MDLFICWANAQRSQVAEGFAKKYKKDVISCASVEARKEKYFGKPEKEITKILLENYNIDISKQKISYPKDIIKHLDQIENIYFLFDVKKIKNIDNEVMYNGKSFWEYLDSIGKKYNIYEIEDPDEKNNETMKRIVKDIKNVIDKIYNFN